MNANLAAILYIVSGVLFILALRGLSSPTTSQAGNRNGMIGMAIAVGTTLWLLAPKLDPLTIGLIVASMLCLGFTLQNVAVGALTRHAAHAGSAAALMGTWQFVLGASSVMLVGRLTDGTPRGMASLMLLGAIGAATADLLRPRA